MKINGNDSLKIIQLLLDSITQMMESITSSTFQTGNISISSEQEVYYSLNKDMSYNTLQ